MVTKMKGDSEAMAPRSRSRGTLVWALGLVAVASLAPHAAGAQAVERDTATRTFRLQLRSGETTTVRVGRLSMARLRQRLDSLSAEFDSLESDAPERSRVERQIDVLIRTLGDHMERAARGARVDEELSTRIHAEIERSLQRATDGAKVMFHAHGEALPKGWIGINVEAPQTLEVRRDSAYVRYFTYPRIVSVEPNSPAEEVGIARGDRLLAYNGIDVRGRPVNVTRLLRPDSRLVVTVRRDGESREFSLVVREAPLRFVARRQSTTGGGVAGGRRGGESDRVEVFPMPRSALAGSVELPEIVPSDRLGENAPVAGASLSTIRSERMGRYFGVSSGILVIRVFGDPATSSGLEEGDVIVRAAGRTVTTVPQLRRLVEAHFGERSIELAVVRHEKPMTIKLRW